jgi:flagellar basal-body rod protein FlgB
MVMTNKLDDYLRFNQTALNLRETRQQLLASNIANADTPNYKARDIDFNSAMKNAMARSTPAATQLTQTAAGHVASNSTNSINGVPLLYRTVQQGNIDGNTVSMDIERNQFADNSVRYEAGLTLIGAQIKSLLSAITG